MNALYLIIAIAMSVVVVAAYLWFDRRQNKRRRDPGERWRKHENPGFRW